MKMKELVLERLRKLLAGRDLGNGTPLADAAADAIILESEALRVGVERILALTDRELLDTADTVRAHLDDPLIRSHRLAFGTKLDSYRGLNIGDEVYRPDAGCPGLHEFLSLREDAHGPNLERVMDVLPDHIGEPPYDMFGLPRPVTADIGYARHFLQFEPFPPAGDVVLRQRVSDIDLPPFGSLMPKQLETLVNWTSSSLVETVNEADLIAERVGQIRRAWARAEEVSGPQEIPLSLRAVVLDWEDNFGEDADYPWLGVEYEGLDDRLQPARSMWDISGHSEIDDSAFCSLFEANAEKLQFKARLRRLRALGLISEIALSAIRASAEEEAVILKRVLEDGKTTFDLPGEGVPALLVWSSGCVEVAFRRQSLCSTAGDISIPATLPDAVVASAAGHRLSSIVDLPLDFDAEILQVHRIGDDWLRFELTRYGYPIDARTRTVRAERLAYIE